MQRILALEERVRQLEATAAAPRLNGARIGEVVSISGDRALVRVKNYDQTTRDMLVELFTPATPSVGDSLRFIENSDGSAWAIIVPKTEAPMNGEG